MPAGCRFADRCVLVSYRGERGQPMQPKHERSGDGKRHIARRDLLKSATALAAGVAAGTSASAAPAAAPDVDNAVARENAKPGTADWQLTYMRPERGAAFRTKLVEGYCSRTSVRAGETIAFHLSADPASNVRIDIY